MSERLPGADEGPSTESWIERRTGAVSASRRFLAEPLPPNVGWLHVLGSAILFVTVVQLLTGAFLLLYYAPTPDHALDSLRFVDTQRFGQAVRGMHVWGATFAVVLLLLHTCRVFVSGAFRAPREVNWILGVALLLVVLGFAFTGYLLPWDQRAYWATVVGTQIMGSIPLVGEHVLHVVRGGDSVGALTLTRFFATHVIFLPAFLIALVLAHLTLLRRHGPRAPHGWSAAHGPSQPFAPAQLFRDTAVAFLLFVALLALARFVPPELGDPADPGDTTFVPRPEWYFLALFQLLKVFDGPLEIVGTLIIPGVLVAVLFAVPFIDRRSSMAGRAVVAAIVVLGLGALTVAGWSDRPDDRRASGATAQPPLASVLALAGRSIAEEAGCAACHVWNAVSVDGKRTSLHAQREQTADWLFEHLLDPHAADSTPKNGSRALIEEEAAPVEAFLAALDGPDAAVLAATTLSVSGSRLLFDYLCTECHAVAGAGGDQGPELTRVGALYDRAWIEEQILDPKQHRADGKMPAYAGKIDDDHLQEILDFLGTLR